ncbi:MAG: bis(5'-nucleosyl)-tetraphosphatase [Planctomycetota bacterium]|jgi:putative nucleotidyltransferase with HDIG domain
MKRACGFVLFRETPDRFLYLTLQSAKHGDLGAPKGHIQPEETELETAYRETKEETGIVEDRLAALTRFRRAIRYRLPDGEPKEVVYYLARTEATDIRLSPEHSSSAWRDLDETIATWRHEDLRQLVHEAAVFAKDPILRRGLDPARARELLTRETGADTPLLDHSAQVAGMAGAMAEAWGGLDAEFVEAAAWLHDVGRARNHGPRHALEGFRLLVERGHPGYAPTCLSHYLKGGDPMQLGLNPEFAEEMWSACDLDTFGPEERIIALADAMAQGPRRVTVEERLDELVLRYGESRFLDHARARAVALRDEFEARAGLAVSTLLDPAS